MASRVGRLVSPVLGAGLCVLSLPAWGLDLAAAGAWSLTIDASDLQAGAGSDLVSTHDSAAAEVVLAVSGTVDSSDAWRIDVRLSTSGWDPALSVWVRRTGAGSGDGTVSSGSTWQQLGATDASFFSGAGDRTAIPIQLRVTGLSLGVPPDAHLGTVHYTVVDTL